MKNFFDSLQTSNWDSYTSFI